MLRRAIDLIYRGYEELLIRKIKRGNIPSHVAIIMDGNRRFASRMGKMTEFGHSRGARITEQVIEWSYEIGVKELTVYAFSTENFNRSFEETEKLFELIGNKLDYMRENERTHEKGIRVRAIGNRISLPPSLQRSIDEIEKATKDYNNLNVNVAIAYGGRQDIIQAVKEIAMQVSKGELDINEITESTISRHLYPSRDAPVSNVDLIIRTGGDERTSNFMTWQANGNECAAYFCAPFWPDFRKIDMLRSIRIYQSRMEEKKKKEYHRTTHFSRKAGNVRKEDC